MIAWLLHQILFPVALLATCMGLGLTASSRDDLDNITFRGRVVDQNEAAIENSLVVIRHHSTGLERTANTAEDGTFRIVFSEQGTFDTEVSADGFAPAKRMITIQSGRQVRLDFVLVPVAESQEITVEGGASAPIDITRTVVGDTILEGELENLPISDRDPLQLVFLLAGVSEPPLSTADLAEEGRDRVFRSTPEEAGIFSLTGAPATSNNITIDGLDNNDDRTARERLIVSPDSVAEVQVITNQYAAEYGRASGGRINIRTRAGGNQYRGEAYFFFNDEALNANTFARNARGLKRLPLQRRRLGTSLSGPIKPAKHFLFANYERLDVPDFVEISTLLPLATNPRYPLPRPAGPISAGSDVGLFELEVETPETRNLIRGRVDLNPGDLHQFSVRFDLSAGQNKRGFPGGARLPDSILVTGRDSRSISLTDDISIAGRILNQARLQVSLLTPRFSPAALTAGVSIDEPARVIAGAFTGSSSSPAFAREERRLQFQEGLSIATGRHILKAGMDLQLVRSTFADLFATAGQYRFNTVADFLANRPARFIQRFNTESRISNDVAGAFLQDGWRLARNLNLSIGLRWDRESILSDRNNFSPRLSVAWNPFGVDGGRGTASWRRSVIRAGFGIFYNRALLRTLDDFSLGRSTVLVDSAIAPEVLQLVTFPGPITDPRLISEFGVNESRFLRRVDRELEIPYTIQAGLGLEQEIRRGLVVVADYIFTRGAHLWRESNINAPVLPSGFTSFTEFLLSRDFDNRASMQGNRPISSANADIVRFDNGSSTSSTSGAVRMENGVRVLTLGLNAPRSSNLTAALNALRFLRPDPSLTQVELLESTGNSFYHGGLFTLRYSGGRGYSVRAVYTVSKMIDEGTTNTASPQDLRDRRSERALSLQDQRHRLTISGMFRVPWLAIELGSIVSFGSSRPFNIGTGFDRNLNDIPNDRPVFKTSLRRPVWRRPGEAVDSETRAALDYPTIGSNGTLPRNYGRGPGTRTINLRASKTFELRESIKFRTAIDAFNVFNQAVFSFGSEFVDRGDADFLVPRRTQRPRALEASIKMFF